MPKESDLFFGRVTEEIQDVFGEDSLQLHTLTSYIKHYQRNLDIANNPALPPLAREHASIYAQATLKYVEVFLRDEIKMLKRTRQSGHEDNHARIIGDIHP